MRLLPAWYRKWRNKRFTLKCRRDMATILMVLEADAKARKAMRRILRMDDVQPMRRGGV